MMTIEEIRASKLTLEQLEVEKNLRDAAVQSQRAEMNEIRRTLEPMYCARNQANLSAKTTVLKVGQLNGK